MPMGKALNEARVYRTTERCWFINPINYSYLRTINLSEIGVKNQLKAILGASHCRV